MKRLCSSDKSEKIGICIGCLNTVSSLNTVSPSADSTIGAAFAPICMVMIDSTSTCLSNAAPGGTQGGDTQGGILLVDDSDVVLGV